MVISTFNYWEIVAPFTLLFAAVLGCFSITEESGDVKHRGSNRLWTNVMFAYALVTWVTLANLFVDESLLGMIEVIGRDWKAAPDIAKAIFCIVAFILAVLTYVVFVAARKFCIKHIKTACKQGRSKSDLKRRRRAVRDARREKRLAKKKQALIASGKLTLMPDPPVVESKPSGPNAEQKRAIAYRVQQEMPHYEIKKCDNLDYTDEDKHNPISSLLPTGVYEYYIAVNLKDENANPIFLGYEGEGKARENLERCLREDIEAQVCASQKALDDRIKQISKAKPNVKIRAKEESAKHDEMPAMNQ